MQVVYTSFDLYLFPRPMQVVMSRTLLSVERETGLEPATTCLEGRDSTN